MKLRKQLFNWHVQKRFSMTFVCIMLVLLPAAYALGQAAELPEYSEDTFKNCIFGAGMECYGETWVDEGSSGVSAFCGDEGASAQIVKPRIVYYQNGEEAIAEFETTRADILKHIDYYDTGCPDIDPEEICELVTSDNESMEAGFLSYYSSGGRKITTRWGEYVLLSGNQVAYFYLHGYPELMSEDQSKQYYQSAKTCLKEIVSQDACLGVAIPLPEKQEDFEIEYIPAAATPGSDLENVSPLGFGSLSAGTGNHASDEASMSIKAHMCPYDEPVDILVELEMFYTINASNKITTWDQYTPSSRPRDFAWKPNFTGELNEALPRGFGGLFPGNTVPRGDYTIEFNVYPASDEVASDNSTPYHSWNYFLVVDCECNIDMPEDKHVYVVQPQAFPTTGGEPAKINPFGLSTFALGGIVMKLEADICLGDSTDVYLGFYSPRTDPFNVYFANHNAASAADLYEQVSVGRFLFGGELPQAKWDSARDPQSWPDTFFVGSKIGLTNVLEELPRRRSFVIYAITPPGVRDTFYAWILPLSVDIKDAFEKFWVYLGLPETQVHTK